MSPALALLPAVLASGMTLLTACFAVDAVDAFAQHRVNPGDIIAERWIMPRDAFVPVPHDHEPVAVRATPVCSSPVNPGRQGLDRARGSRALATPQGTVRRDQLRRYRNICCSPNYSAMNAVPSQVPTGARSAIPVDVRIISAPHVDLESAMREGRFRVDLFHRLCVLRVDETPLPARGNDIEILAHHILHKFKTDSTRKIRGFTPSAIEAMYNYNWPGNVRELINRVRHAILMAENKLISGNLDLAHFTKQKSVTLPQALEATEKRTIEAALLRHRHRLNEAVADKSRVSRYAG